MKEKRILAMFVTSVVTLVASLAVTFGVLLTLADPVVATGVLRYDYSFNAEANSYVVADGDSLKLQTKVAFQPSSKIVWSEAEGEKSVWFNGSSYEDDIIYADESISTRLKVIPVRITNNYSSAIQAKLNVVIGAEAGSFLAEYTEVQIYDYVNRTFTAATTRTFEVAAGGYVDVAVVVYADDSINPGKTSIDWGNDAETIDVVVTNTTKKV